MSIYRPKYRDPKTGEKVESTIWWYEFTFAGKRVRESANTPLKTLARDAEKDRRRQMERALAGVPTEKRENRINTVGDFVSAYLARYAVNHRAKSATFAKQRLAHVTRLLGKALASDLTEERMYEYITTRLNEDAGGRTINMELGELSRAIGQKWSVIWPKLRKLEENHDVGRALTPEEETRLLRTAAADDSPNRNRLLYTFLRIALTTGMRSGEISGLTWDRIDFAGSTITVGKAKTRAGSGRQIPMNADLRAVLEAHASWYAKQFGPLQPDWYVFPGRKGRPTIGVERPMDPRLPIASLKSSWDALREDAGVSCRLHDLRHTVATKMAEAGVSESTMLALLGHMSRAMLERYSHIRMKAKREAVESLMLPDLTPKSDTVPKESPKESHLGVSTTIN